MVRALSPGDATALFSLSHLAGSFPLPSFPLSRLLLANWVREKGPQWPRRPGPPCGARASLVAGTDNTRFPEARGSQPGRPLLHSSHLAPWRPKPELQGAVGPPVGPALVRPPAGPQACWPPHSRVPLHLPPARTPQSLPGGGAPAPPPGLAILRDEIRAACETPPMPTSQHLLPAVGCGGGVGGGESLDQTHVQFVFTAVEARAPASPPLSLPLVPPPPHFPDTRHSPSSTSRRQMAPSLCLSPSRRLGPLPTQVRGSKPQALPGLALRPRSSQDLLLLGLGSALPSAALSTIPPPPPPLFLSLLPSLPRPSPPIPLIPPALTSIPAEDRWLSVFCPHPPGGASRPGPPPPHRPPPLDGLLTLPSGPGSASGEDPAD